MLLFFYLKYGCTISIQNDNYSNKNKSIKLKKEYELIYNNNKYNLEITVFNKNIYFKLYELNNLTFKKYVNKFNIETILTILKLNLNIYNSLEKVLELFDNCYRNKKIKIDFRLNIINLIIKYPLLFQEQECIIVLKKEELDVNEKFDAILKEIMLIRENYIPIYDKLKEIEILISELKLDVNRKFEENINIIEMLKNKIEKNKIYLENNNNQIKCIKKDIFFIRHKNIESLLKK